MKIEESDVALQSNRAAAESDSTEERRLLKVGNRWISFDELYAQASKTAPKAGAKATGAAPAADLAPPPGGGRESMQLLVYRLLLQVLDAITGGKPCQVTLNDWQPQAVAAPTARARPISRQDAAATVGEFATRRERYQRHEESESTTFSAQGTVKTGDGREIAFGLQLSMSRQFVQERCAGVEFGKLEVLKDPLVVNFGADSAGLTAAKFSFDLDGDGRAEQVSGTAGGSGFLALDLNGDGKINDGRELFGTASGDGFADLAAYDRDGNGWIDESDPVFSRLRIWEKDGQGKDMLSTLDAKGIGAIYLGHAATEFSLKNPDHQLQGRIRASGVYLAEDGSVGSVQQVDLAV